MPSRSHGRCKVCRKVIHARHRFGMCKQCSDKHYARLSAERRAAKERRRLKALATTVLEEGPAMPLEPKPPAPDKTERPPRDRLAGMSDDRKLTIAGHYANYDIPVEEIVHHYAIANGDVTRIADELGVPRRDRRNVGRKLPTGRFIADQWVVEPDPNQAVPPETEKALENMLRLPAAGGPQAQKLPPRPEPVAPTPTIERRVLPEQLLPAFDVNVEGRLRVRAVDMLHAIQQVMADHPDLRITQISEV